jgi:Ca2+-binding RTX toxin-like protein
MAINIGTEVADDLSSSTAGDVILGLGGDDVLVANAANITLDGGLGDDQLFSFVDGATLIGGPGDDFLLSLGTNDTASYAGAPAGVAADLSASMATDGTGGTDTLLGIENVTGSAFNDSLTGDDLANVFQGGAGNDTLTGNGGNDVFKYSFNLTQGGGGATYRFTDWLSDKYGKDFGDELPDFSPKHHHHDHHHHHGKNDGHHSKGDHCGDDRNHAQDGLTEKFFEKNYQEWVKEVVVADLLEQGFVLDANGNGKIKIDINDDSRNGTPRIEGLTKDQLAEIFGDRDSVILNDGGKTEKAWYSNSYTSSGGGKDTVASTDGFDTIVDFKFGAGGDKLDFSGITKDQFLASFVVDDTRNVDGVGGADTVITIAGNADWSLTLLEVSGHDLLAFSNDSIFS